MRELPNLRSSNQRQDADAQAGHELTPAVRVRLFSFVSSICPFQNHFNIVRRDECKFVRLTVAYAGSATGTTI